MRGLFLHIIRYIQFTYSLVILFLSLAMEHLILQYDLLPIHGTSYWSTGRASHWWRAGHRFPEHWISGFSFQVVSTLHILSAVCICFRGWWFHSNSSLVMTRIYHRISAQYIRRDKAISVFNHSLWAEWAVVDCRTENILILNREENLSRTKL